MRAVILKRLALSIPLVFAVTAITFILISLTPGDAADAIYGAEGNPAAKAALRKEFGLDRPLPVQYGRWLSHAVRGDFGKGLNEQTPVTHFLALRVWTSVSLIIGALVVSILVGLALGVFSAVRGGVLGRLVDVLALLGVALPSFIMGVVLIVVFASILRWLPATGYVPITKSPLEWSHSPCPASPRSRGCHASRCSTCSAANTSGRCGSTGSRNDRSSSSTHSRTRRSLWSRSSGCRSSGC
jgi:peptide/nickel transport system permease protein